MRRLMAEAEAVLATAEGAAVSVEVIVWFAHICISFFLSTRTAFIKQPPFSEVLFPFLFFLGVGTFPIRFSFFLKGRGERKRLIPLSLSFF